MSAGDVNAERLDVGRELAMVEKMTLLQKPYVNSGYATGSILAGLGTPTSDLDVIVLVGGDSDKDLARQEGALRRHGRERADVDVLTVDEFADVVGSCADFQTAWADSRIFRLGLAVRLLSQFTAAMHVIKPSAELSSFSKRIASQRHALVQISIARSVIYGNNMQEDLLGLTAVSDEVGMLRRSHDYLNFGLDAWCTSHGSVYPDNKFKWLWRRLNLVLHSERELAELRALHVPETATGQLPDVARRRREVSQALLAQALLTAWAQNPQPFAVPILPRRATPVATLWRSPDWMPTRTPDAWGLGANYRFYEMPVEAVIAWTCAGGRMSTELEAIVIGQSRAAFGSDVGLAGARRAVARLLDCGALQSRA